MLTRRIPKIVKPRRMSMTSMRSPAATGRITLVDSAVVGGTHARSGVTGPSGPCFVLCIKSLSAKAYHRLVGTLLGHDIYVKTGAQGSAGLAWSESQCTVWPARRNGSLLARPQCLLDNLRVLTELGVCQDRCRPFSVTHRYRTGGPAAK